MKKDIVENTLISAAVDPEIRKAAEKFASTIPTEWIWIRSKPAEIMFSMTKGIIKELARGKTDTILLNKSIQFLNYLQANLFKAKCEKDEPSTFSQNWTQAFWEESQKKLENSPLEKLEEVRQQILEDFKIRTEIFRIVLETEKEFQQPKSTPKQID